MDRHFLLTVSEDLSALYGARFVGHFFSDKAGLKLTLFYTVPRAPQLWTGERNLESVSEAELQSRRNLNRGNKALHGAKNALVGMGFNEAQIDLKLQPRRFSKAMDILQEGADGLYDSVILGHRGLSWIEEAIDESVSKEVLNLHYDFPVWICRKPDLKRKGVLVCVDGTEASKHMVDHVGFIMAHEKEQDVTLFSVQHPDKNIDSEAIFHDAVKILGNSNFPAQRIQTRITVDSNPTKAILNEATSGAFSAVAVGRRVRGQRIFQKMFFGSVSTGLFKDLEGAALWICY